MKFCRNFTKLKEKKFFSRNFKKMLSFVQNPCATAQGFSLCTSAQVHKHKDPRAYFQARDVQQRQRPGKAGGWPRAVTCATISWPEFFPQDIILGSLWALSVGVCEMWTRDVRFPVAVPAEPRIPAGTRFLRISPHSSPHISPTLAPH